jgi:hypothetical protein
MLRCRRTIRQNLKGGVGFPQFVVLLVRARRTAGPIALAV